MIAEKQALPLLDRISQFSMSEMGIYRQLFFSIREVGPRSCAPTLFSDDQHLACS
jgi:hypothetical protein